MIWCIEEGDLDKITPKVVVLMIGTNNTMDDSAKDIANANRKIISMIQDKRPDTKILLLAVFPRGPRSMRGGVADPWEMRMDKIRAISADMTKLDNGNSIRFLDLGPKLPPPMAPSPKLLCLTNYTLAPLATKSGQRAWLRF